MIDGMDTKQTAAATEDESKFWPVKGEGGFLHPLIMCKLILTTLCTTYWASSGALSIFYLAKPSTTESFLLHIITLHSVIIWSRKVDSPAESQLFSISTPYCHNIQLSAHNKPLRCIVQYILHWLHWNIRYLDFTNQI